MLTPLLAALLAATGNHPADDPPDFRRDVRPLLADRCWTCHGPDAGARQRDLRLDDEEDAKRARAHGRAIDPAHPERSLVVERLTTADPARRMPPPGSGKELSPAEREVLLAWVRSGAPYRAHWAFEPPRPVAPPTPGGDAECHPVDAFVDARLAEARLVPNPPADRALQARRLAIAITGIAPTPDELDRFLADRRDGAWERLLDRLLASPRHGEHLARDWLDLARYADTNGYQYDTHREQWGWRDWVIDACNDGMPFDRFTRDQMAGDLLEATPGPATVATGFHRNHPITIEGGVIDEEYRTEYVLDRVAVTSTVWLGLTLQCARCHDHKYDPFTMRDHYALAAYFDSTDERGLNAKDRPAPPFVRVPTRRQALAREALRAQRDHAEECFRDWLAATRAERERFAAARRSAAATTWVVQRIESATSTGGETLTLLEDDSVLVTGADPARTTYEVAFRSALDEVHALRLEALPDERLPARGPGRHANGNFVLTEVELAWLDTDGAERELAFARASADHEQNGYPIAAAIDGERGSGWAVDGNVRHERRTAVLHLREPLIPAPRDGRFRLRLRHESRHAQHGIGRFRIALARRPPAEDGALWAEERPVDDEGIVRAFANAAGPPAAPFLEREHWARRLAELDAAVPPTLVLGDRVPPRTTTILERGQYDRPGEPVGPGIPAALGRTPRDAPPDRRALAEWLVSDDHPLVARVVVNRLWLRCFGRGLVATPDDFGTQGAFPSHPELLDWLARELVASGWDRRHVLRLITTSHAFRRDARAEPELRTRDPENALLARGPRFRLDAEVLRDLALAASGLLVEEIGGPSVKPWQPPGLWLELGNREGFSEPFVPDTGRALYRRSLYTYWKRAVPPPAMTTFDAPNREACTVSRSRTNTPLQALVLLHDPQWIEAARHLAWSALRRHPDDGATDARLVHLFRSATSRHPSAHELDVLRDLLDASHDTFAADHEAAERLLAVGPVTTPHEDPLELAALTEVARACLNLHDAQILP